LSKATFFLRKKESQIMQISKLHPGVQRVQNVWECSAKEALIVLIRWNILPKQVDTFAECLGIVAGREDNKDFLRVPSLSKILY